MPVPQQTAVRSLQHKIASLRHDLLFTLHFSPSRPRLIRLNPSEHCPLMTDQCLCVPNHTRVLTMVYPHESTRFGRFFNFAF